MNDILKYKDYYGSVQFSAADEVFYGKILAINDLVSFEGSSVQELKAAFEEAVEDYLETCLEMDKVPDKTYKGTFNVRVPSELHRQAALFAALHNITLNDFVRRALAFTLENKEKVDRSIQGEEMEPA